MVRFVRDVPGSIADFDISFYGRASQRIYQDLSLESWLISGEVDLLQLQRGNAILDLYGTDFPDRFRVGASGTVEAAAELLFDEDGNPYPTVLISGMDVKLSEVMKVISTRTSVDDIRMLKAVMSSDDRIILSQGDDAMSGFRGDDRMSGRGGDDVLSGAAGDDRIMGGAGHDTLRGNGGVDVFNGGGGDDILAGGGRRDVLLGGGGDDILRGQAADDRMDGGAGADTIIGGAGSDTFLFRKAADAEANTDRILDFVAGSDALQFLTGDTYRTLQISDDGDGTATIIEHAAGTVVLVGVSADELTRDDFAF